MITYPIFYTKVDVTDTIDEMSTVETMETGKWTCFKEITPKLLANDSLGHYHPVNEDSSYSRSRFLE